jgi:hypothetical protein
MTNEQQRSPIFCLDKLKKHLYNTIWGIKQLLTYDHSKEDPPEWGKYARRAKARRRDQRLLKKEVHPTTA